ncbi:MAG: AEC family transporter [Nocardioides sp.]|uniref:AEC family transporter n=1 Tax=Nocardioides sp. TaxID=35761 RepID=UPI0039E60150
MGGVVEGFGVVALIILTGWVLAQVGLVDMSAQKVLSTMTFYVASPALLLTMLQGADVHQLFSGNLLATGGAVVVSAGIAFAISRLRRHDLGHTVITMLSASYVNANNLGIPIATYVLGNASASVPTLLLQLVVIQPVALTFLDIAVAHERLSVRTVLSRPFRNPMTLGSAGGLLLALTGWRLPTLVHDPLAIIGGMSVPCMLIAYGISLRLGPLPGRGVPPVELGSIVVLKMVVQPLAAYAIGRFLLGFEGHDLLAVTVLSALPTAQNVFVMSVRYNRSVVLARDAIFVNTFGAIPVLLTIAALLA